MKTVDERLRAAARDATRIFPACDDLPPLHLPAGPGGNRRFSPRSNFGQSRRTRGWLAPLAAGAAVAIVSAGFVVVHQAVNGPGTSAPTGRRTHGTARDLQRERQQRSLDALVAESVAPATGPQYDRGTKLLWLVRAHELVATARCMAAAGYRISAKSAPFNLAAFADNTQMPDLPRIARTHEFVSGTGVLPTSYPRPEQNVYSRCMTRAAVPFRPLLALDHLIGGSWWQILTRIRASAKVRASIPALNACATRYGFPNDPYGNASTPIRAFPDFMNWVAGFLDGAGSRGASSSKMRALELHWTRVFVTCARPIVSDWQRLQLAAQPGFLARHAAQLGELDHLTWRLLGGRQG